MHACAVLRVVACWKKTGKGEAGAQTEAVARFPSLHSEEGCHKKENKTYGRGKRKRQGGGKGGVKPANNQAGDVRRRVDAQRIHASAYEPQETSTEQKK